MKSLLIYDEHCGWSPSLNASKGTGGTEVHLVQIATRLARRGVKVAAFCHEGKGVEEGVLYRESRGALALQWYSAPGDILLTVRRSRLPTSFEGTRILTLVTDDPRPCPDDFAHLKGRSTIVCVSEWQAGLYRALGHECVVIPAMIDDAVYAEPRSLYRSSDMMCLSAWNKGSEALLKEWPSVGVDSEEHGLFVGSPYSHPSNSCASELCSAAHALWLGELVPAEIVANLRDARAHVRVCSIAETFGATDAISEAVGCHPYVLCTGEVGALTETLAAHVYTADEQALWARDIRTGTTRIDRPQRDFRVSTIMPMWERLLGL